MLQKKTVLWLLLLSLLFVTLSCASTQSNEGTVQEQTQVTTAAATTQAAQNDQTTQAEQTTQAAQTTTAAQTTKADNEATTAQSATEQSSQAVNDQSPLGKFDPAVDMYFVKSVAVAADQENRTEQNNFIDFIEDKLGIRIHYKWVTTPDQYDQRIALMLATNDLADCVNVDMKTMGQMIDAEQASDLTQVWDIYASDLTKELMDAPGTTGFGMATRNGVLYGIPQTTPTLETMHVLFLREDWRLKLDLPEPDTFQNLEEILYAFTNGDPDGNGINDTFGIGMNKSLYGIAYEMTSIANGMHAYPNAWIRNNEGQVIYGSVQPEMKLVLEKLAQWYADGLIDPEFIVKDENIEAELVLRELMGATFGVQWTQFISNGINDLWINNPESAWRIWRIPSIDSNPAKPIVYDNTRQFAVIRNGFEYPEAAIRILNMMHQIGAGDGREYFPTQEDFSLVWGDWTWMPLRPESIHGNMPKWVNVFAALDNNDPSLVEYNYNALILYDNMVARNEWLASMENPRRDGELADKNRFKGTWGTEFSGRLFAMASELDAVGELMYEQCGAIVTDTMVESDATLKKLELETFTRIITGEASINEFDEFVENWHNLGGTKITEEINQWYASN